MASHTNETVSQCNLLYYKVSYQPTDTASIFSPFKIFEQNSVILKSQEQKILLQEGLTDLTWQNQ
jgi:hypothetical protein